MKEEQVKKEAGNKKVVLTAIVFFLIGFGAAWIYSKPAQAPAEKQGVDNLGESIPMMGENALAIDDQNDGETAIVKSVTFKEAGWVAIQDDNDGTAGNTFGATWLPAGEHENVLVELLRPTIPGKTYYAVLHADDGDKKYDSKIDAPITDASSTVLKVKFMTTGAPAVQ